MPRQKTMKVNDGWFLNCVALIKRAPGVWVPGDSVRELDKFFLGYMKARDDLGLPEYGANEEGLREMFQEWLCAKLGVHTRVGWVYCVEQLDGRADNASTFVSLFEEFLAAQGRVLPEADVELWVGAAPRGNRGR